MRMAGKLGIYFHHPSDAAQLSLLMPDQTHKLFQYRDIAIQAAKRLCLRMMDMGVIKNLPMA